MELVNKIILGDCLEVMKEIPDKTVDVIITDPPYGINFTPQRNESKFNGTKVLNDDNLKWLHHIVKEYKRVLKPNSVGYIFCNWQNYDIFKQSFEKEFIIKNCIVWDKKWFGMGNNWRSRHEFILVITNGNFKTKSNNKSNILSYTRVHPCKLLHFCEKPIELLMELINESCEPGSLILDSFAGSGTTAIAALKTGRSFICIEMDETYYNIAKERIEKYAKNACCQ